MDFLEVVKAQYSGKPYGFWKARIGGDPIIVEAPDNSDFEIDVSPVWEGQPGGSILVLISESSHRPLDVKMRTVSFVVAPQNEAEE